MQVIDQNNPFCQMGKRVHRSVFLALVMFSRKLALLETITGSLHLARSMRSVPDATCDKVVPDKTVQEFLHHVFTVLHEGTCSAGGSTATNFTPSHENTGQHGESQNKLVNTTWSSKDQVNSSNAAKALQLMHKALGFNIERQPSVLAGGGRGVVVNNGRVPRSTVVALYPGTIYRPFEPILLQSLGNPFIFRCLDGLLVDGNDRGISKFLYRSCAGRERMGPYETCDTSWLTEHPLNPLAVGQYVNNQNTTHPANVAYQEFDVPQDFPLHLRRYIPNVFNAASLSDTDFLRLTRTVVLVSTRDIEVGEELFSNYFTFVH